PGGRRRRGRRRRPAPRALARHGRRREPRIAPSARACARPGSARRGDGRGAAARTACDRGAGGTSDRRGRPVRGVDRRSDGARRQAVRRLLRTRWLRIAPALAAMVLAIVGAVGAVSGRSTIAGEAYARTLAANVRPLAVRETALLETASRRRTRAARAQFFA